MAKGLLLISSQRTVGGFSADLEPLDLVPKGCLFIWVKNRPKWGKSRGYSKSPSKTGFYQEKGQVHICGLRKAGGRASSIPISVWASKGSPWRQGLVPKQDLWRQMPLATEIWCGDREQVTVSGHGLQNSRDQGGVFSMPDP